MSFPLVSIITPTYNHERFIGPCIDSVLRQSYPNWQLIVIDDGSTDRTAEIVRSYRDLRIQYVNQENQGLNELVRTYNRALSFASGELVAILEGDDLWPDEKLTALVPAFSDPAVVLAYGAAADVSADGSWSGKLSRSVRKRRGLSRDILFNNPVGSATRYLVRADGVDLVPPSTVVIRHSALDRMGGFQHAPGLCVTDFPTFLNLSVIGGFHYLDRVMGFRRRHVQSATFLNAEVIVNAAYRFVKQFIADHAISLTSEEWDSLEVSWTRASSGRSFTQGRLSMTDKRWKQARRHFSRALDLHQPRILAAAAAGWMLSWVHCDLEGLAKFAGVAHLTR